MEAAKRLYRESLEIYRRIRYRHGIGAALNYLGQAAYLSEEYEQAQALSLNEAVALAMAASWPNEEGGKGLAVVAHSDDQVVRKSG